MKRRTMTKSNWTTVIAGIIITYFGFFLVSFVKRNYDGDYAFFSLSVLVSGLIIVTLGLSLDFDKKSE